MAETPLRVLIVEDNPADAKLMMLALEQDGFAVHVTLVQTEADYLAHLKLAPDIILCDFSLPQFDAMWALEVLKERQSEIPFLIVSGSIGEDTAVEAIKRGAHDYILKDRLGRLGSAVSHALEERKLRESERRAREALRASEAQYRALADSVPHIVWTTRPDGAIEYVNQRSLEYSGHGTGYFTSNGWDSLIYPDDLGRTIEQWGRVLRTGEPHDVEFRLRRADGVYRWHMTRQVAIRDQSGAIVRWIGTCTDIEDQKAAVEQLARDSLLLSNVRDSVVVTGLAGVVTYWNEGATQLFGWTATEMVGRPYADRFPEPTRSEIAAEMKQRAAGTDWNGEYEDLRKDGSRVWIHARITRISDTTGRQIGILTVSHNITERKRSEQAIRKSEAFARAVLDSMTAHIAVLDRDGVIVAVNESWRMFVVENLAPTGPVPRTNAGTNYLEVCDASAALGCDDARATAEGIRKLLAGKIDKLTLEYPCHAPNEHRWFLLSVTPHDAGGCVVSHINITARREAEDLLRNERDRFAQVAAVAPGVICSFQQRPDGSTCLPYSSPGIHALFGLHPEDLIEDASAMFERIHPGDIERVRASIARSAHSMTPWRETFRATVSGNGELWIAGHSMPTRVQDGSIVWHGFLTDVSAQKRAEGVLRFQHALLECQTEASPDGVLVVGVDNRLLSYNRRFLDLWDIPAELAEAGDDAPVLALARSRAADPDAFAARVTAIYADPDVRTNEEVALADGRTLDRYSAPIRAATGERFGRVWFFRDITNRKQVERELQKQQRELRLIFDTVPAVIFYKDLEHRLVRVNDELVRLVGVPREEIEGRTDLELGSPHAVQYSRDEIEVIATGRAKRGIIEPIVTATGIRWLQTDKLPHRDEAGNLVGVIGFAIDITERKQAEESFRQAQERLQHVIASSPAILFSLVIEGDHIRGIAWMSENVREVLGYSASETTGTGWWKANMHPDDRDRVMDSTERELIAKGRVSQEYRFRHQNGQYRWLRSEIRLVLDATGESVEAIGSWSDVTERQMLEGQYRQAQKMEAFGQLAAGVAHDFNNLLTVINGYSELLIDEFSQIDPRRTSATEIRNAGARAAALTAQLLSFSRKSIVEPKVLDLNELIDRVGKMLRRLIGEDITLITDLAPALSHVMVDQSQMEQVIMNLAVNARDAMPKGGRLTIETQNVDPEAPVTPAGSGKQVGRRVRLVVSDTGTGMTDEVKAKIFEPFFTTKEVGKGTGLGLATVFGIVNQSGGHIEVTSLFGVGTAFTILLPAVSEATSTPSTGSRVTPKSGTETILLVEDEQPVRRFAKQALEARGYKVLDAANGAEALRLVEQYEQVIHLVVTDVVMPGMGGRELVDAVRRQRPNVRVLYTSGYTDDAVLRYGVREEIDAFLPKPFNPLGLAQKVRAVLDAHG